MKELIKIYIALVVFVYLLFSFALWQIDASQWEQNVRFLFSYLLFILTFVAILIKKLNEKN
jgi:hypothetical protein